MSDTGPRTTPGDGAASGDRTATFDHLRARIRSLQRLTILALAVGLGVGFYVGFIVGVDTAREVATVTQPAPAPAADGEAAP